MKNQAGLGDLRSDQDWEAIEAILPEGWQEQARQLGAFTRGRAIPDPSTLLRILMAHLGNGCGLRETAARVGLAGISSISDVAILKRLRKCGDWFEWMCQQLRNTWLPKPLQPKVASCWSDRRIRLIDSSVVSEPGATGSKWRLHYSVDFPSLHADEVILSSRAEGETLKRFTFKQGDIGVADRCFANPAGVAHVVGSGADIIVRTNLVTLPLYDETGARLDVLSFARKLKKNWKYGSWTACVHYEKKRISGRLCIVKKDRVSAQKARIRARRESQRSGSQIQEQTLEAASYILIFTTLGNEFPVEQVMELYRARWQIELVFKRLKSLAELGHLKKSDANAARAWLQGKLLIALLIEALLASAESFSPWGVKKLEPSEEVPMARVFFDA